MPRPAPKELRALGTAGIFTTVFLVACGVSRPSPSSVAPASAPSVPSTVPSASASPSSAQTFTNQNWGQVLADPTKYKGATVVLSGTVFNVEQDAARMGIQMWTDPLRGQGNTVVIFPKQGFPEVHNDDQIDVQGALIGEFDGKNDAGEALKLPKVEASAVKVTRAAPSSSAAVNVGSVAGSASAEASAPSVPSVLASPSISASATAAGKAITAGTYRVHGSEPTGLAIRIGPAVSQRKLGAVHDGGLVLVSAEAAPGWAAVQGDGFSGYASLDYLAGAANAANQPLAKLGK